MAIVIGDLQLYESQRMTDNSDGGGRITSTLVNKIFDDESELDRTLGDVSVRKVFASVNSDNDDKLIDSSVMIYKQPDDTNIGISIMSTNDMNDTHLDIITQLENTIGRGGIWQGRLWGTHVANQKTLTMWQFINDKLPLIGDRLEIVKRDNSIEVNSQFVRIEKVNPPTVIQLVDPEDGKITFINMLLIELSDKLLFEVTGSPPAKAYSNDPDEPFIYSTRYNASAVDMYGITPLVEDATVGDLDIKVESIYTRIIPTSLSETPIADSTPGGDILPLSPSLDGVLTIETNEACIAPNINLLLNGACMPGSINIDIGSVNLYDDGIGILKNGPIDVATIDYSNGTIAFNTNISNYGTAAKVIEFQPAITPTTIIDSMDIDIPLENGHIYVTTLSPIPSRKALTVSYQVNGDWYEIKDRGDGYLEGADSSYGSATLNYETGTIIVTTIELPDVGSKMIFTYGSSIDYFMRGSDTTNKFSIVGQLPSTDIMIGTLTVVYPKGSPSYTLTDNGLGILSGDGTGTIDYATGDYTVIPNTLPAVNTEFYATAYEGDFITDSRNGYGAWGLITYDYRRTIILNDQSITPNTVLIEVTCNTGYYGQPSRIIRLKDDGVGGFTIITPEVSFIEYNVDDQSTYPSTIDYVNGIIDFSPRFYFNSSNTYTWIYDPDTDRWVRSYIPRRVDTYYMGPGYVRYSTNTTSTTIEDTVTLNSLTMDITRGFDETIVPSSVRFNIVNEEYIEKNNIVYKGVDVLTGVGSQVGTLNPSTGKLTINSWTSGIANSTNMKTLVTTNSRRVVNEISFRLDGSNISPGTFQLRYTDINGDNQTKIPDNTGILIDNEATINIDYTHGYAICKFGKEWVYTSVPVERQSEYWYDIDATYIRDSVTYIWEPIGALPSSLIYNAVSRYTIPPDSTLLGINAAKLPADGKILSIYNGKIIRVHSTDILEVANLSPSQVVTTRPRIFKANIYDSANLKLPYYFYDVDVFTGNVTMSPTLDLTGYTSPYFVHHVISDLASVRDTDISGLISLNKAITHDYDHTKTLVSGVLYAPGKSLQARYTNLFSQTSWTNEWSDYLIGTAPLAQYNDTLYPFIITNKGAYPGRYLIKFTSSTTNFQVIHEDLGLLGIGDIFTDCSPINPLTGVAYLTIKYEGWGTGDLISLGNCWRFNVVGAIFPVDVIRSIQPSEPTQESQFVELLFTGNVEI